MSNKCNHLLLEFTGCNAKSADMSKLSAAIAVLCVVSCVASVPIDFGTLVDNVNLDFNKNR